MTPAALVKARDGDANATADAVALWESIVGREADPDATPPVTAIAAKADDADRAGVALDVIGQHVGSATDVPDGVIREAVVRTASYLDISAAMLGLHGSTGEGGPDGDPRTGGYSALRRSGTMALLAPWKVRRAGAI